MAIDERQTSQSPFQERTHGKANGSAATRGRDVQNQLRRSDRQRSTRPPNRRRNRPDGMGEVGDQ